MDCGVDFLVTQMFFDNSALYSFLYRAQEAGITVPVLAGIMPVTNAGQMTRILSLSGTTLPNRFRMILDKFRERPDAMKQAGIVYAAEQMVDLVANGVRGGPCVHHEQAPTWPPASRKPVQGAGPGMNLDPRNRPLLRHPGKALDPQGTAWADQCQRELAQTVTPRHLGRRRPSPCFRGRAGTWTTTSATAGRASSTPSPWARRPTGSSGGGAPSPWPKGAVGQAVCAAWLDEVARPTAESLQQGLAPGEYLTSPFSPGYGDWDLGGPAVGPGPPPGPQAPGAHPHRRGGCWCPKSVTALVGISDRKEEACRQKCMRRTKPDCPFRAGPAEVFREP